MCGPELRRPLVNRILIAHTAVAPRTNRNKVVQRRLATLAFRDIVSALIVKDVDLIPTPRDTASAFKLSPHPREPDLLSQGLGNLLLFIHVGGHVAKLHCVSSSRRA